jgi:hypothetical protein
VPRLSKKMKEILAADPFFIYGRVHPSEYDWKAEFADVARAINGNECAIYIPFDSGKVLGLAAYAAELEDALNALKQAEAPVQDTY